MVVKVVGGVPAVALGHGGLVSELHRRRWLVVDFAIGVVLSLLAGTAGWTSEEYPNPGLVTGPLGIRRVFGEPIERDGVTVVPVAVSVGGGGTGTAPDEQGSGGGFGGIVRGIGVDTISKGQVRFIPAVDTTALAILLVLTIGVVGRAPRRR